MNKQQGFVSIITASVIMVILTLMVIGFSQLMQREQRQSLDRQLSSQALYATDVAVNDLYDRLQKGELVDEEKTECDVSDWPNGGVINPNNNVNDAAYTCLLYDQTPTSIDFNNGSITTQQSKIFPVQPKANNGQAKLEELTFSWSGAGENRQLTLPTDCPSGVSLPQTMSTPGVPILRIDLVRLPTDENVNIAKMNAETASFFLYPKHCGDTQGDFEDHLDTEDKGKVIYVDCPNPDDTTEAFRCNFTLNLPNSNGVPGVQSSNRYFARVKSVYNDADFRMVGKSNADGGGPMEFIGAQISVDVTGKSNDVLRRISVQIGNPSYPIPEFVIQGLDGVCKGITIAPSIDPLQAEAAITCP